MAIDATAVQNLPNVPCIDKCTPHGTKLAVLIALAAQWGGLSTDPAVLQKGAQCFVECIPAGLQMGVLVSLASQILSPATTTNNPTTPGYTPTNPELNGFCSEVCTVLGGCVVNSTGNVACPASIAAPTDNLITCLKAAGVWNLMDAIYPMVGGTLGTCAINLKNPGTYNITWHGGVTASSAGVTGDGATGYGDTGFNAVTAGGNYSLNSASFGVDAVGRSGAPYVMGAYRWREWAILLRNRY